MLAGVVLLAGVVTSAVVVGSAPVHDFASDAPVVSSLLLTTQDVPGAIVVGHQVYRPSQVAANPSLFPTAAVLHADRACALLEGPTSLRDITALGVNGYAAQYELVTESTLYADAGPVEADRAALGSRDLLPCVQRLLVMLLRANGLKGTAVPRLVSLDEHLGDVYALALSAYWQVTSPDPTAQFATDSLEFVVLLHARAEVVILAQNDEGPLPQALIDRVAGRLAGKLEAQFPG